MIAACSPHCREGHPSSSSAVDIFRAAEDVLPMLKPAESKLLSQKREQALIKALSETTRLAVLRLLSDGQPWTVTQLSLEFHRPLDAMARHLRILRDYGALEVVSFEEMDGRLVHYRLNAAFLKTLPDGAKLLDFGPVLFRI